VAVVARLHEQCGRREQAQGRRQRGSVSGLWRYPLYGGAVADRVGTQLHASAVANMDANTGGLSYDGLSTGFMVKGESTISDPL